MILNGIILVDKPVGYTSFDVVGRIRHVAKTAGAEQGNKKRFPVGHSGTLDPLASGLLIILLGSYTKQSSELMHLDKVYSVKMVLGKTSSTGDQEGIKVDVSHEKPTRAEIDRVFSEFTGEYSQTPPIFSAIKVNGQRSYKLARSGESPKLESRRVKIYELVINSYSYPTVTFQTKVSSGTYIRSLVEDIGMAIGTGAYTGELRRESIGSFDVKNALSVEKIDSKNIARAVFDY
jgi:tRNA pseudouridine55 synthase